MKILFFSKAKKYSIGEVSAKTGLKKVAPGKWTTQDGKGAPAPREKGHGRTVKVDAHYEEQFDRAVYGHHMASAVVQQVLEDEFGVRDYGGLSEQVKLNPEAASNIYRKVLDEMRHELREEYNLPSSYTPAEMEKLSPAEMGLVRHAQAATKQLAEVLTHLKEGRKTKLMVKVDPNTKGAKKGIGASYMYRDKMGQDKAPVVAAAVLKAAKEKMGGWTMRGEPKPEAVEAMLKNGSLETSRGTFDPNEPISFIHRGNDKGKPIEVEVPFREGETGIKVPVRQGEYSRRGAGKRVKVTASGNIEIPYALAVQFIATNVSSVRTRNDYIGQVKRSTGFQKFLETSGQRLGGRAKAPKLVASGREIA